MNASFASQKTRRKLHRKVFERINQNEEHLVNICELNILESHRLPRTLQFYLTNDKNENNSPQSYRRWMHLLMNTCNQSISSSVFYQVLNAVSDGAFKRKCLM